MSWWAVVPSYALALVALAGCFLTWRRGHREDDVSYFHEVRDLRQERQEWLSKEGEYERRLGEQEELIRSLKTDIEHFKRLLPMALVGSRFLDEALSADLAWLMEKSGGLWWVTSPMDRGSVVWASSAWERLLGCTQEDLRGTRWRAFLHPAARITTDLAEARAWRARIDGFVNTFVSRDGREHELRWFAPPYGEGGGITLSLAVEAGAAPASPLS